MAKFVRVNKKVYSSPTVKNGWVERAELRAYRDMLVLEIESLGGESHEGVPLWCGKGDSVCLKNFSGSAHCRDTPAGLDEDGRYWYHKVRNRRVSELARKINELNELGIDKTWAETFPDGEGYEPMPFPGLWQGLGDARRAS